MVGIEDLDINSYAKRDSMERWVFLCSELAIVLEFINHLAQVQAMKRHIFLFALWSLFIAFFVIPLYPDVSHSYCFSIAQIRVF